MPTGRSMTSITLSSLVILGLGACLSQGAIAAQGQEQHPSSCSTPRWGRSRWSSTRTKPRSPSRTSSSTLTTVLRQPDLPPRHPQLHDPGRRDDRADERESRGQAPPIKNESGNGCRTSAARSPWPAPTIPTRPPASSSSTTSTIPISTIPGRRLCRLRQGHRRHGRRRHDRQGADDQSRRPRERSRQAHLHQERQTEDQVAARSSERCTECDAVP